MQPTWALPKILWLDRGRMTTASLHSADFVAAHLVGHPVATDTSHALKTGYDLVADAWPTAAFDKLGLPVDLFPEVVLPGTELGRTPCRRPGLRRHDRRLRRPDRRRRPRPRRLELRPRYDARPQRRQPGPPRRPHRRRLQPPSPRRRLASRRRVQHRRRRTHRAPARRRPRRARPGCPQLGPIDAAIYPLTKTGERFPFVAPAGRALHPRHDSTDDLTRTSPYCKAWRSSSDSPSSTWSASAPTRSASVSLTGGAVRSGYWNQLRADVLGVPVELPAAPDPAYGMAVLAASSGGRRLTETARRMVRVDRVLEPRTAERSTTLYGEFVAELDRRGYRG